MEAAAGHLMRQRALLQSAQSQAPSAPLLNVSAVQAGPYVGQLVVTDPTPRRLTDPEYVTYMRAQLAQIDLVQMTSDLLTRAQERGLMGSSKAGRHSAYLSALLAQEALVGGDAAQAQRLLEPVAGTPRLQLVSYEAACGVHGPRAHCILDMQSLCVA